MTPWTDKKEERLRRLWNDTKMTASQIAADLGGGITRNAVISKARHMRLDARKSGSKSTISWTEEKVSKLRQLCSEGISYRQIAAALGGGIYKNAVINKAHLLGLPSRGKVGNGIVKNPPRSSSGPDIVVNQQPANIELLQTTFECVSVSFLDLNSGMCKWPTGNDCYCGNPAPWRAPYCVGHSVVAYQVPDDRKRWDRNLRRLA